MPWNVRVDISVKNGDKWEAEIAGQVKRSGCCDWGFGQQVLLHFCGGKDAMIFAMIFQDAMEMMEA